MRRNKDCVISGGYREEGKEGERRGMSDGKIEKRVVYPVCV